MRNISNTIEDLLEILAGLQQTSSIQIDPVDATIMHSIARQTFKGTALTDRQYNLMREKLQSYKNHFTALDYDFDQAIDNLRQPLRTIDRSKYIKLQDNKIVIRFPFRKTEILLVQEIQYGEGYSHNKGSHTHEFSFNEINVLNLLDRFSNKEFEIDQELINLYHDIKSIHSDPQGYLSGVVNNKLINIAPKLKTCISNEIGELTKESFIKFIDRRFRYGLDIIDNELDQEITLTKRIANRKDKIYHSKPSKEQISNILDSLWELDRFPLLVILDNNPEDQLYELANYYRDILNSEEQSVLYRLEEKDAGFNQLIKDRKLNNWVDKSTKVVYISKNKLPKLLVNNEWKPSAALCFTSTMDRFVDNYISFNCDLIMYREEIISPMRRHSRYYA